MPERDADERAQLMDELRGSWARGAVPSELLRGLLDRGWRGARLILFMQDAFGLALSKTNAITSWLAHRDDERLDRFLSQFMPARVAHGGADATGATQGPDGPVGGRGTSSK